MPSLRGVFRKVCPRCEQGPVYRKGLAMYERCPVCDLKYEREQGYFLGAMYVSYMMGVPIVLLLVLFYWKLTNWPLQRLILASAITFLLFVPMIIKYSRLAWLHIDRTFDPDK